MESLILIMISHSSISSPSTPLFPPHFLTASQSLPLHSNSPSYCFLPSPFLPPTLLLPLNAPLFFCVSSSSSSLSSGHLLQSSFHFSFPRLFFQHFCFFFTYVPSLFHLCLHISSFSPLCSPVSPISSSSSVLFLVFFSMFLF